MLAIVAAVAAGAALAGEEAMALGTWAAIAMVLAAAAWLGLAAALLAGPTVALAAAVMPIEPRVEIACLGVLLALAILGMSRQGERVA